MDGCLSFSFLIQHLNHRHMRYLDALDICEYFACSILLSLYGCIKQGTRYPCVIHAPAMCQAQIQKLEEGLSSTLVLCWRGWGLEQVFFHWLQEVLLVCSIPVYWLTLGRLSYQICLPCWNNSRDFLCQSIQCLKSVSHQFNARFNSMWSHIEVSGNGGTPKSSILVGLSLYSKPSILGYPHFMNPPYEWTQWTRFKFCSWRIMKFMLRRSEVSAFCFC